MYTLVIGAGTTGLAIARTLALANIDVLLMESQPTYGTQTSSRHSEVIHAGIYYPTHSLKAKLCVQGNKALYAYCQERAVDTRRCGKLIVATDEHQREALHALWAQAQANGVDDLQLLSQQQARALEPNIACVEALWSPRTGIIDSHGLMRAMLGDFQRAGGAWAPRTSVDRIVALPASAAARFEVTGTNHDGSTTVFQTNHIINASGLAAIPIARAIENILHDTVPTAYYAKGNYFSLRGASPTSRLIYPIPDQEGLGIHLTMDLGGQVRFGPDVEWVDQPDGFAVDASRATRFYEAIRRYWPALPTGALSPDFAGIRPKIVGPGEVAADFLIQGPKEHGVQGLIHLFGIESPGMTACLGLAEMVHERIKTSET